MSVEKEADRIKKVFESRGDTPKPLFMQDRFSVRDEFAMAALTGILFSAGAMVLDDTGLKSNIAKTAYEVADEMIAARERG